MAVDTSTRDAIDDIFYDGLSDFEDTFNDKPTIQAQRDDKPTLSPRAVKRKAGDDGDTFGLGLDEEVKISKKRRPVAKLDEARLLSEPGIPKLRALIRSKQTTRKLRLKGKGHEFNDAAKLLNHFQLWLDDLYPRAKFADALSMVEKAGHTKRMQITRCEWINEGKPGYMPPLSMEADQTREDPDLFGSNPAQSNGTGAEVGDATRSNEGSGTNKQDDTLFIPDANQPIHDEGSHNFDDDELEALLAEENETSTTKQTARPVSRQEESEGEDDLDALLAEQDMRQSRLSRHTRTNQSKENEQEEEDYDDLDALLAEQDSRQQIASPKQADHVIKKTTDDSDDAIQLPSPLPSMTELENDPDHADQSPDELVDEHFLSSSPLPNEDNFEDDHVNDVPTHQTIKDSSAGHNPPAETISDNARNGNGVEQTELEEDYLSSSPIDLSQ